MVELKLRLPELAWHGRAVVLLDDVASTGHTVSMASRLLWQAGAASVDVAVNHALFAGDALQVLREAGVGQVWSTAIAYPMAPALATALQGIFDAA